MATGKVISFYEIAKIKMHSEMSESINLIEKSLKLRQYFPPYVCHYVELLIENNNLSKAKKYLYQSWRHFPHPDYKSLIKLLSKKHQLILQSMKMNILFSSNKRKKRIMIIENSLKNY